MSFPFVRAACCVFSLLVATGLSQQPGGRLSVSARTAADVLEGFDGRRQDAERTTLSIVQRVPGAAANTEIQVGYLRLRARALPAGSPIVFLMGGPGVPATLIGRIPPYWSLFEQLRSSADVILLDQRGVGISRPSIDCPAGKPPRPDFLASNRNLREALRATYAPCVAMWRERGFPAELFSVSEIAADIEEVRRQLAAPRVSLLAFSYGTRLALEYVRLFPERVDRVVLQATLGFDDGVRLPSEMDGILDRVSTVAASDPTARALLPDVRAALVEQFRLVERRALEVSATTEAGDPVRLTIGREGLQTLVAGHIADPRLPALVASLRAGDPRVLASMASGVYRDLANGGGSLFGRAVYCSAPGSEQRQRLAARESAGSVLGEVFDNAPSTADFCREIGITPGPRPVLPSRALDRAALFIQGSLDDRAPPANVERAARYFGGASVVTVENGGHELLPIDEVQSLVADFFSTGRVTQQHLTLAPPRFQTVEEALQPSRRR